MNLIFQNLLLFGIMLGFAGMEWTSGRYKKNVRATSNDTKLELCMLLSLLLFSQPLAILATNALCSWLIPAQRNALIGMPWWGMFGLLLFFEDQSQYWWHRISHSPTLWPLHRAHHTANYMSIRITYRNNFFYYLAMPGLWLAGLAIYLGFGQVYAFYILVKITVILGAHCAWPWDERLYRIRALRPLMWLVQRTISTPSTHWAHHSITNDDGIGHYKGNFGNLLFFWDVLYGTAYITRLYPADVGLHSDRVFGAERWNHQMFYPVLQSKRARSTLRFGGSEYASDETAKHHEMVAPAQARSD
jgi:sterol desaturase/sphingolipid hydroxylase (fatty acid hydroxylase superfamily)